MAALTISACTSPGSRSEPPFEFGKLKANLNGGEFTGIFGRDSILAIWSASPGQMQIQGDKRRLGRRSETMRVMMRCLALPKPGTYAIGNLSSPVSAEAFIAPTLWQRIWPLRGARYRAFVSDSRTPGSLVLDTVDSATGVVRGRFSATLKSFNTVPTETLTVRGAFFGRVDFPRRYLAPSVRWAPWLQTDCERIRDAVSM